MLNVSLLTVVVLSSALCLYIYLHSVCHNPPLNYCPCFAAVVFSWHVRLRALRCLRELCQSIDFNVDDALYGCRGKTCHVLNLCCKTNSLYSCLILNRPESFHTFKIHICQMLRAFSGVQP